MVYFYCEISKYIPQLLKEHKKRQQKSLLHKICGQAFYLVAVNGSLKALADVVYRVVGLRQFARLKHYCTAVNK